MMTSKELVCRCGSTRWKRPYRHAGFNDPMTCSVCGWLVTPHWLDGYLYGRWEESHSKLSLADWREEFRKKQSEALGVGWPE